MGAGVMERENGWCCQMYGAVNGWTWLRIRRWSDCSSSAATEEEEERHESG